MHLIFNFGVVVKWFFQNKILKLTRKFIVHFRFYSFFVWYFSVQFCCSVMSDSLRPHALQHARLPCPSPTLGDCSNSCQSSWWCHPIISSFVVPFSSCLQSFPALGSFPMSQFFTTGGPRIGASASVLPVNIQDWFPLVLTGLISFSPRYSQESSPTPHSLVLSFIYGPTLTSMHAYWQNHSFDYQL